ncbi:carbohydrate binding domain-containing protein [Faecalibacter rhinopitheci]|uniref:Carbohydrate binding domain-containing protein n=1 Tax=Faecalibacter rhinopitheci TaxID=2779678 RepID=A0A8J7KI41_9FLAO|nr:carbohydrate binding domain-containing protein [Faecalibacter rhinopitheci]MBF0597096.1 carbohydrate binding domain-containing protein [Faecalibacter rhinopitheci]
MKINKLIYTWLLLFGFFQIASAQVVFKEDFGKSKTRLPSVFVPQVGKDATLIATQFSHGSKFYKLAEIAPNYSGENEKINVIDNGYYAVISPKYIYSNLPADKPSWATWWKDVPNYTDSSDDGAVLVVNGGKILNQFYRRAVSLEAGKTYRVNAYVYANGQNNVKIKFEAQNISTEQVLGNSEGISTTEKDKWIEISWVFKIPNNINCSDIAISLRNDIESDGGNDFYVDDITLEKIEDQNIAPIECSNSTIDEVIKANDNVINYNTKSSSIISDDSIEGIVGGIKLKGDNRNATISQVGNWPLGYTIDTETGELKIAEGSGRITGPLQYRLCNLLGVCSIANITFTNGSISTATSPIFNLQSEILETCFTGNSNNKKVRYTLKNVSNGPIEIIGESRISTAGKKLKFNGSNIDVNSLTVISGNLELTGTIGYAKAKTFAKDEVVVFEMNYTYSNLSDEIVGGLELRYGNASASGPMNNPDVTLNVSNNISRIPEKPNNITRVLNETGAFTIYQASGLRDAAVNFKFYDAAGIEIPYNTPINMNFTGELEYSYSRLSASGCESEKGFITLSKTAIELPKPGEISLASDSTLEELNICPTNDIIDENGQIVGENPIKIFNKQDAQGTYVTTNGARYGVKYSWEVSYDDGITWNEFSDSDGNQEGETSNGRKEIILQNVKSKVWIRRKAQERPEGTRPNRYSYSNILKLNVQKNNIEITGGNFHSQPLYFLNADEGRLNQELNKYKIPVITSDVNSTVEVIDQNGRSYNVGDYFQYTAEGTYTFTVKVTTVAADGVTAGCVSYASLTLTVYDLNKCKVVTEKVIATAAPSGSGWGTTLAGLVANKENAYDNDLSTHSTISVMVGLLGLGTTWQNIYFDEVVEAGTPLHVKLGQEYSGAQVGGGLTIVALDANDKAIGPIKSVGEGALLDLLTGDNVFEYVFVPADGNGVAKPYKGVRVILGSLLAIGNNAVLYGAYYEKDRVIQDGEPTAVQPIYISGAKIPVSNTQPNKLKYIIPTSPEDIVVVKPENIEVDAGNNIISRKLKLNDYVSDISWGNQDIGLGVATSLASVVYPYLAVDDDPYTYAIFNKTVGALNAQTLDVRLRREARPGDELEVIMTNEGTNVLSLDLGADFTVQRYLDDQKVGPEVASNEFKVLNLNLLLFKTPVPRFRIGGINQPFNRVVFKYTSIVQANLGNQIYLHDVSVVPQSIFDGVNVTDTLEICAADFIKIQKPSACTEYKVSFALGKVVQTTILNSDGTSTVVDSYDELEDEILPESLLTRIFESDSEAHYEINRIYDLQPDQILLMKVQTIQNGQEFGGPQYIRVNLKNCLDGFVNPTINLDQAEKK